MTETLQILYGDTLVGALSYDRRKDAITLAYDEDWRFSSDGFPASLSLPLEKRVHTDDSIRPFLQGLLPDNPAVLEAWGKRFQGSPRNPFDLIKHVGEDCAGALQFVRPERLERILSGELDSLLPLDEENLEKRISALKSQSRAVPVEIEGRFSLAGAQTKDALYQKDGKWFVPGGRIPSTHILKPEIDEFEYHALNEHFCLMLASRVGLRSTESSIIKIGGKSILCVERYDRVTHGDGPLVRWHQEDLCQALGRNPQQKYQVDGGPSASEIVTLLDRSSDDYESDVVEFIGALAFNWIIAGTDAHSKNYSLIHGRGSFLRSAPLYDLASWLPYERDPNSRKIKLAMKIGGTYRLHEIDKSNWMKWAEETGLLSPNGVIEVVNMTVHGVLDSLPALRDSMLADHDVPFVEKLALLIQDRARKCEAVIE
jgi:serine/threonine-protein kinase HipA